MSLAFDLENLLTIVINLVSISKVNVGSLAAHEQSLRQASFLSMRRPSFKEAPAPSPLRHFENIRSPTPEPHNASPSEQITLPTTEVCNAPSPRLMTLPAEIIDAIVDYLDPVDIAKFAQSSKECNRFTTREALWELHVQANTDSRLGSSSPYRSFRDLYKAHHPFWWLPKYKIWFSDNYPHGKLLLARYDHRSGAIEAYALAGRHHGQRQARMLPWNNNVVYQTFDPLVQLDLNQPVIRLMPESIPLKGSLPTDSVLGEPYRGTRFQSDAHMQIPSSVRSYANHLNRTLVRARDLPSRLSDTRTSLWPPMTVRSPGNLRTRASSSSSYASSGHRPARYSDASTTAFRLRQRVTFHPFTPLQSIFSSASMNLDGLPGEQIDTFATIDPSAYTPTAEKPWQGIYVGDYSAHGCEFLLVTQPDTDTAKPLPAKARKALQRWPHATQWQALLTDAPGEEDDSDDDEGRRVDITLPAALQARHHRRVDWGEDLPEVFPTSIQDGIRSANNDAAQSSHMCNGASIRDESPFKGRLEAIKLTGDPNIPRGELTFIADDLGHRGLAGHTKETDFVESKAASEGRLNCESVTGTVAADPASKKDKEGASPLDDDPDELPWQKDSSFKGSRMVRSVGHVCEVNRRSRRESYIPTQLILISPGRLAQWWMPVCHLGIASIGLQTDHIAVPAHQLLPANRLGEICDCSVRCLARPLMRWRAVSGNFDAGKLVDWRPGNGSRTCGG